MRVLSSGSFGACSTRARNLAACASIAGELGGFAFCAQTGRLIRHNHSGLRDMALSLSRGMRGRKREVLHAAEADGGAAFRLAGPASVGTGEEGIGRVKPGSAAQHAVAAL